MPRRKLARRFEPRYGVSETMLEIESRYVARELEDQLLQSTNELREQLAKWKTTLACMETKMQDLLSPLPDRQRLALRCMFARDCWHMAMLYKTYIRNASLPAVELIAITKSTAAMPEEIDQSDEPIPNLPFRDTLFS